MTNEEKEEHLKDYLLHLLENKFYYIELEDIAVDRVRNSFGFTWYLFGIYCRRFLDNVLKSLKFWK